jgi:hypothetical protein
VTSKIAGNYFAFNGDFMQKNKVDSIIPGLQLFKPLAVEIWTFPTFN